MFQRRVNGALPTTTTNNSKRLKLILFRNNSISIKVSSRTSSTRLLHELHGNQIDQLRREKLLIPALFPIYSELSRFTIDEITVERKDEWKNSGSNGT